MPTKDEHMDQAMRNEELADKLIHQTNPTQEWRVTLLFYAALHWVEAYFSTKGMHGRYHSERLKLITTLSDLSGLYHNYRQLQTESENARYQCRSFTEAEVSSIKLRYYAPIKSTIQTLV